MPCIQEIEHTENIEFLCKQMIDRVDRASLTVLHFSPQVMSWLSTVEQGLPVKRQMVSTNESVNSLSADL